MIIVMSLYIVIDKEGDVHDIVTGSYNIIFIVYLIFLCVIQFRSINMTNAMDERFTYHYKLENESLRFETQATRINRLKCLINKYKLVLNDRKQKAGGKPLVKVVEEIKLWHAANTDMMKLFDQRFVAIMHGLDSMIRCQDKYAEEIKTHAIYREMLELELELWQNSYERFLTNRSEIQKS